MATKYYFTAMKYHSTAIKYHITPITVAIPAIFYPNLSIIIPIPAIPKAGALTSYDILLPDYDI
ncbi:MAG: hypothetical protein ACK4TA_17840 [Saprospiraceae bacterium]